MKQIYKKKICVEAILLWRIKNDTHLQKSAVNQVKRQHLGCAGFQRNTMDSSAEHLEALIHICEGAAVVTNDI